MILPFRIERQKNDEWCWAAVAASIDHFFSAQSTRTQCQIVTEEFGKPCCAEPLGPEREVDCDQPSTVHVTLERLGWLAEGPLARPPVPFEVIRSEIDAGRPLCVFIRWRDGGQLSRRGHFFVIAGYQVTARSRFVFIQDPLFAESLSEYEKLASDKPGDGYREGQGVWRGSFLLRSTRAVS